MIEVRPWDDASAMQIFADLDVNDALEAALWRGDSANPLALFADWRAVGAGSLVAFEAWHVELRPPFAVMALTSAGAQGVATAALMARDHTRWQRPLTELARHWRRRLPSYCAERGVTRCECRSWAGHPTASRLLRHIGFRLEAHLSGFGGGPIVFDQYAWTANPPTDQP